MTLSCQACGASCNADSPPCPGCRVIHYCCVEHLHQHAKYAHGPEECSRMAQQLERGQGMFEHDMPWPVQGMSSLGAWLDGLGCQEGGLLQRCCELHNQTDLVSQQQEQEQQEQEQQQQQQQEQERQQQQQQQQPARSVAVEPYYVDSAGDAQAVDGMWLPGTVDEWQQAWGMPDTTLVPAWRLRPECGQLQPAASWQQYYDLRQLSPASPAALVLHYVLTLWHLLVNVLPSHGWPLPPKGHTIRIAYLGPQGELSLLPAFLELAMLLPHHDIELHFIGPDVPESLHKKTCRVHLGGGQPAAERLQQHTGTLQVSCWASCFHDAAADWEHDSVAQLSPACTAVGSPEGWVPASTPAADSFHLVFGANAGLPAYASWLPSLQQLCQLAAEQQQHSSGAEAADGSCHVTSRLKRSGTPVIFSDYCEEAACMSDQVVQHMLGRSFNLACCLNPFRDPVPATSHGTHLPACSNAFLFGWV